MRIWDVHPGYLSRQSLLGEHRELHGIVSILVNRKKGYARHPETVRWIGHGWALKKRHEMLVAEMALRGYSHQSPVLMRSNRDSWPQNYIDDPARQFQILQSKYRDRNQGRIPLPANAQQIWSHHKYSVMARDVNLYKKLGREISAMKPRQDISQLTSMLTEQLRLPPSIGGLRNALQHMWGHISGESLARAKMNQWSLARLLNEIQRLVTESGEPYLLNSTALSELKVWIS